MKPVQLEFFGGPWDGEVKQIVLRGPDFFLGTNGYEPPLVHVYCIAVREGRKILEYRGMIASAAIS